MILRNWTTVCAGLDADRIEYLMKMKQVRVALPRELIEEIDLMVGRKERVAFLVEGGKG